MYLLILKNKYYFKHHHPWEWSVYIKTISTAGIMRHDSASKFIEDSLHLVWKLSGRLKMNWEIVKIFDHVIFLNCGKVWVDRMNAMRTSQADIAYILIHSFHFKSTSIVRFLSFENLETMRILVQILSVIGAIRPRETQNGAVLQNEIDFANSITPMIDPNCPLVLNSNMNIPKHTLNRLTWILSQVGHFKWAIC